MEPGSTCSQLTTRTAAPTASTAARRNRRDEKKEGAARRPPLETSVGVVSGLGDPAYTPYSARPNVALMKTPICSRVTGLCGQYSGGFTLQPVTTPRRTSSSIHLQKGLEAGTSLKTGVPQAGGFRFGSSVRSTKIDICSRVTACVGQYVLGAHPFTTVRLASSSMNGQKGLVSGTSL